MTWVVAWTQGKMVDQFTGHVPDERIDEFLDNLLAVKLEVAAPAPNVGRGVRLKIVHVCLSVRYRVCRGSELPLLSRAPMRPTCRPYSDGRGRQ